MANPPVTRLTEEQYLEIERAAFEKSEYHDGQMLVVEVLSPSSEAYDRGKKFEMYRTVESLRDYVLVHQDRVKVEHYARQENGGWLLREAAGREGRVEIGECGLVIGLGDLYATAIGVEGS